MRRSTNERRIPPAEKVLQCLRGVTVVQADDDSVLEPLVHMYSSNEPNNPTSAVVAAMNLRAHTHAHTHTRTHTRARTRTQSLAQNGEQSNESTAGARMELMSVFRPVAFCCVRTGPGAPSLASQSPRLRSKSLLERPPYASQAATKNEQKQTDVSNSTLTSTLHT